VSRPPPHLVHDMSRILALAFLLTASAEAQVTFGDITLHNGLASLTDVSAIKPVSRTVATQYLTDASFTTVAYNMGTDDQDNPNGGALEGRFVLPLSVSDTHIYVLGVANYFPASGPPPFPASVYNGIFSIQLVLASGLTSALSYSSDDYVVSNTTMVIDSQINTPLGVVNVPDYTFNGGRVDYVAYLPVSLASFNVSPSDVLGIRFTNMTSVWLDVSYIGTIGTPVPEPSTYGLILGGLALAGAALRRRKSA